MTERHPGDVVFAARALKNDGSHPEFGEQDVMVDEGTRGVIVNIGELEYDAAKTLLLVRFEASDGTLGPPVGCWPNEVKDGEVANPAEAEH